MKRLILIFTTLLITLLVILSACTSQVVTTQEKNITITTTITNRVTVTTPVIAWLDISTFYQYSETISVEVYEIFTVALPRQPRLGLDWGETHDEKYLSLLEKSYEDFGPSLMGGNGNEYFIFQALREGTSEINFIYSHGIPDSIRDEKTFTVSINS